MNVYSNDLTNILDRTAADDVRQYLDQHFAQFARDRFREAGRGVVMAVARRVGHHDEWSPQYVPLTVLERMHRDASFKLEIIDTAPSDEMRQALAAVIDGTASESSQRFIAETYDPDRTAILVYFAAQRPLAAAVVQIEEPN